VLFDHWTVQSKVRVPVVSIVVVEVPLLTATANGAKLAPTPYVTPPIEIIVPEAPVPRQVIKHSPSNPRLDARAARLLAVPVATVVPPSLIRITIFPILTAGAEYNPLIANLRLLPAVRYAAGSVKEPLPEPIIEVSTVVAATVTVAVEVNNVVAVKLGIPDGNNGIYSPLSYDINGGTYVMRAPGVTVLLATFISTAIPTQGMDAAPDVISTVVSLPALNSEPIEVLVLP